MIDIVDHSIDSAALVAKVTMVEAGAVVLFLGTTRSLTHGRETKSLDYECYPEMARAKLAELESIARQRWPILGCEIVHRIGNVAPGEASVAVAVSTAHRDAAFEAGKWLIDTLKEEVPIWKRENWADGTTQWVHPGLGSESKNRLR